MVFYCGVQTQPVRYVDPQPAEYCEAVVENEGDVCPAHEEPDDDFGWDEFRESRW